MLSRLTWVAVVLAGCGRFEFDERPPPDAPLDACAPGVVCAPASAVCWTGTTTCSDVACARAQPIDQQACPNGTCAMGICEGSASAPFGYAPAGGNAYFGAGVASDGVRLVVGAPRINTAYVLEKNAQHQWAVTSTLTSTWGPANSLFGVAVAIDGDRIVVGSRYSRGPGMTPVSGGGGAIVIYERAPLTNVWTETAQVLGPDGGEFGNSLAISGNRIVVGAEYANTIVDGWGTAYIVEGAGSSWATVATMNAPTGDRLGHHVQLAGDRAFVGSLWDPGPTSSETGAVRIWERQATGTWMLAQTLQPDDLRPDAFGQGFSVDGDQLAVGVPWFSDLDRGTGALYVYARDPATGLWTTPGPLLPSTSLRDGNLGRGVLLRGDRLFATYVDWNATTTGSVSVNVYRRQPTGEWLEIGRRLDPGGGENGYALGGIEVDLQMVGVADEVIVGYPIRGYTGGLAPGAIVFNDVAGL